MHRYLNLLLLALLYAGDSKLVCSPQLFVSWTVHTVSLINSESKSVEPVFSDSMVYIDNYFHSKVVLSQTERFVSICGRRHPDGRYFDDEVDKDTHIAVIIDLENDSKWTIEDVEKVSWSSQSDLFVYMGGENSHQGDYYYSTGAWLVNPVSKEKESIFIDQRHFDDIDWSEHDNNIYLESSGVVKYEPLTKEIKKTPYRSCNISPDGKYYFIASLEGELAAFFRVQNNSELTIVLEDEKDMPFGLQCHLIEWTIRDDAMVAYVSDVSGLFEVDMSSFVLKKVVPPSPDIDPIGDLVGFRGGRPVWARITGDKAELFYY